MLYAHGSDLCHELELRHAMANCFEALMGALLLDGGIGVADKVFAHSLFLEDAALKGVFFAFFLDIVLPALKLIIIILYLIATDLGQLSTTPSTRTRAIGRSKMD